MIHARTFNLGLVIFNVFYIVIRREPIEGFF